MCLALLVIPMVALLLLICVPFVYFRDDLLLNIAIGEVIAMESGFHVSKLLILGSWPLGILGSLGYDVQCYAAVRETRTDELLGPIKLEIPLKLYQGSVDSTPSGVTISQ